MTLRALPRRPAQPDVHIVPTRDSAIVDSPATPLSGWGRYPIVAGHEMLSEDLEGITRGAVLTRGLGRSYGDASLPPPSQPTAVGSVLADRILSFDPATGV